MKADGTKKLKNKNKEKKMHRKEICTASESKKKRKTGSVYRIVKSSTIYTASFKTQMSSTI